LLALKGEAFFSVLSGHGAPDGPAKGFHDVANPAMLVYVADR